jgi:hypothetical protein
MCDTYLDAQHDKHITSGWKIFTVYKEFAGTRKMYGSRHHGILWEPDRWYRCYLIRPFDQRLILQPEKFRGGWHGFCYFENLSDAVKYKRTVSEILSEIPGRSVGVIKSVEIMGLSKKATTQGITCWLAQTMRMIGD